MARETDEGALEVMADTSSGLPAGRSVIDGAFRILRALPDSAPVSQVADLARLTSLPRPTVYRLLSQLIAADAVVLLPDGRYELSSDLLGLAQRVEPVAGLRQMAIGVLGGLRERTGATVSLVVPSGPSLVALEMLPGRAWLPIDARAGEVMPSSSAAGHVLNPARARPDRLRAFGAAVDQEDALPGLTCYAAAIVLPNGARGALQIATTADQPAETFAHAVQHASRALEMALSKSAAVTPPH